MKDSLTSQNFQDFRQRYEGTYGNYAPDGKEPLMVRLHSVEPERVHFKDNKGVSYYVNADSGIPFEFYPVDRRLANSDTGVLYSSRKPARQWSRGVCDANTSIINIVTKRALGLSFENLALLYKPDKDYLTALENYNKGKRSAVALDDKFCIVNGTVQLYDKPIGLYKEGKATVHKLFKQEFSDLVKRSNFPISVEVLDV